MRLEPENSLWAKPAMPKGPAQLIEGLLPGHRELPGIFQLPPPNGLPNRVLDVDCDVTHAVKSAISLPNEQESSRNELECGIDAGQGFRLAENLEEMVKTRAGIAPGHGQPRWVHKRANF